MDLRGSEGWTVVRYWFENAAATRNSMIQSLVRQKSTSGMELINADSQLAYSLGYHDAMLAAASILETLLSNIEETP